MQDPIPVFDAVGSPCRADEAGFIESIVRRRLSRAMNEKADRDETVGPRSSRWEDAPGYHLVDTVIIVIVIVIASRNLIAMRRSRRPLSRRRLTSTGHSPGTPPFIHMQLPVNGRAESAYPRVNLLAVNRVGIRAIGPIALRERRQFTLQKLT